MLDGRLLLSGQIIMDYVVTDDLILLDDVLPRLILAAVSKIEIDDVEVLQPPVFLGTVREGFFAGPAPSAPDVEQDYPTLVRLYDLAQDLLAIAHVRHVVVRLQDGQLRDVRILNGNILVVQGLDGTQRTRRFDLLFGIRQNRRIERLA